MFSSLRPAGGSEHKGRCPFCDDRKGHLYVNFRKGVYHCFRCGVSGLIGSRDNPEYRRWAVAEEPRPGPGRLHDVYRRNARGGFQAGMGIARAQGKTTRRC